jgi:PAS domain S-box-containing protein
MGVEILSLWLLITFSSANGSGFMARGIFRLLIDLFPPVATLAAGIGGCMAWRSADPTVGAAAAVLLLSAALVLWRVGLHRAAADAVVRKVAEREWLYREVVEKCLQGILIVGETGKVLMANPAAATMLGYASPDDLLAIETIDVVLEPPDRARVADYRRERVAGGTPPRRFDVRVHRRDGVGMWCGLHIHSTNWDDRPVAQVFVVDATERKQAEAALEQARDAADTASRAKREFLADLSREIGTPMQTVIRLSNAALDTCHDPVQRDQLRKISGSAKVLVETIGDIIDFSKIMAGDMANRAIGFNLDEVETSVQTMLGASAEHRGLALVFKRAADLPNRLIGDPLRLGRILRKLVANRIKFNEYGTIIIGIDATERTTTEISLRFSLRDRGTGISAEQRGRLLETPSLADRSVLRHYGGSESGLFLCKRLVETMGGRIVVESTTGHGSIFSFILKFGLSAQQNDDGEPARTSTNPEAKRRRLEAGMNEHLPSTVNSQRIGETVRNLGDAVTPSADFPGIDMADALNRLGGNRDLLSKIYLDFCEQYGDGAITMTDLIAAGATGDAAALAHTIKGVAGNIGASRVYTAAKAIEADLRAGGNAAGLTNALRDALAEFSRAPTNREQGEASTASAAISNASTVDPELFGQTLDRLRALLTARDLDAEECFAGLMALCPDGALNQPLAQVGAALQTLDFEAALGVLAVIESAVPRTAPA